MAKKYISKYLQFSSFFFLVSWEKNVTQCQGQTDLDGCYGLDNFMLFNNNCFIHVNNNYVMKTGMNIFFAVCMLV